MLDSVSELKILEKTEGNIKLQISTTPIDNIVSTTVKWIYTENGVDVPIKSVAIYFLNETLSDMTDTWNLLTIGSKSLISQEEALSMAWEKAKNYTLKFASENGSTIEVKPDLSNVTTEVTFSITTRNSTALHPLWTINFYFNKVHYSAYGIQVSLWGDTKETIYCKSLITLGSSTAGNAQGENSATSKPNENAHPQSSSSPADTKPTASIPPSSEDIPENQNKTEDNTDDWLVNTFLIVGIVTTCIAISVATLLLKRRRSK